MTIVSRRSSPPDSPGMEVEGEPAGPFRVRAFAADGSRQVFR